MCEINAHGGNIVVKKILELCLKNGAELAEPGEFTKRAFLNGRIDLVQAESVIDIINAKSEKEVKTGIKQLEGLLSKEIAEIKQEIMDVMINIEVSIDYPEYDVEDVANAEITDMLDSVKKKLERLERSFDNGKVIKEGIKTAIIGKVGNDNFGKMLRDIVKEQGIKVRYIKLTIYEVPYQQKPCISGLRVFGTGDGEKPQNAEFTVARSENGLDMTVSAKAEQATGYNILWGHKKDKLYHSYLVYGEELKEKRIGALIKDKNYYVRVDTFNENGITEGNTVKMV